MPQTPFKANLNIGAQVWNPWGLIVWGKVPASKSQNVTVARYILNKVVISDPLWDNGKEWSVLTADMTPVEAEPDPDPDPDPEPTPADPFPSKISYSRENGTVANYFLQ